MSWLGINRLFCGSRIRARGLLTSDGKFDWWWLALFGKRESLRFSTRKGLLALISLINFLVEKIYDLTRFIGCFPFKPFKCCFEADCHRKGGREGKFYYDPLVKVNWISQFSENYNSSVTNFFPSNLISVFKSKQSYCIIKLKFRLPHRR